jgi:hypothetical protein
MNSYVKNWLTLPREAGFFVAETFITASMKKGLIASPFR